jgi:rhamnose transport system permease protein
LLVAGAAAGALNGLLVTGFNLPSLLVTLGTMALFRGIGYIALGTQLYNSMMLYSILERGYRES